MSELAPRLPCRADVNATGLVVGALILGCALVALFIGVNVGNCSASQAMPILCGPTTGIAAAITVAALPLLFLIGGRRPLAALFGLYIVLLPIDDVLLVGQSLSITKLLGLASVVIALAMIVRRRPEIRLPHAVLGWAAVVALMALSTAWGINPQDSMPDLIAVVLAFVLLVVIVAAPIDAVDLRAIIAATIASGVVAGIVAMVKAPHELSTIAGQVGRLYFQLGGTTQDPNRFGASLLFPVAMTVGAIAQFRGWRRIGLLAILPFPLAGIYLTASRGATLALIAMAVVAIFRSKHRLVLLALLALGIGLMLVIPNEITSRVFTEGTATGGAGRLDIWTIALAVFRSHWLLGTGVGTFPSAYNHAFFAGYEPQYSGWNRDPHSLLVSTATELGVVGIITMVCALVLQYRSLRLIGPGHPYTWLRGVFACVFVGLLVNSLFVDVLSTKFSWLLFTLMLVVARLAAMPSHRGATQVAQTV